MLARGYVATLSPHVVERLELGSLIFLGPLLIFAPLLGCWGWVRGKTE